jgi:hypothetical protein
MRGNERRIEEGQLIKHIDRAIRLTRAMLLESGATEAEIVESLSQGEAEGLTMLKADE